MNAVVEPTAENVTELRAAGPGERLRAARLAQGLEASKVAAQLHLSEDMVHALERDDYEPLPGRVFVRGYLRNYARLVGLAPESVLKQFDERFPDTGGGRTLNRVGSSVRREVHSSHGGMRLVTLLIVVALLGLFVIWWKGYLSWLSQDGAQLLAPRGESVAPVAADGGLSLPQPSPSAPVPAAAEPAAVLQTPEQASVPEPQPEALPPAALPEVPAVAPPVAGAPLLGDTAAAAAAGTSADAAAAATGIVFEFTAPCWVDVRDTKRNFKLFGEMPKGASKTLGGEPPYKVVLGNASAVRITVDGVPYDIAQHARGNVARFTLDPPRSNPQAE